MDYTKMKDLQTLAILLNTIIPKDDDFLTAEQVEHLHNLREYISWDIAEKYDMDINNGYLDPFTLEFTLYGHKETKTCNN